MRILVNDEGATMSVHAEPIRATVLDTPAGPLSLLARGGTLVAAGFTGDPSQMYARLHPSVATGPLEVVPAEDLPWLVKPVRGYFDGDLAALDALPVYQYGTPLRQRLWQ